MNHLHIKSCLPLLREEQNAAIASLVAHNTGVLNGTTAFGKTVTAINLIAKRKVNTLILVHTKALLEQWKSRLEEFLDIDYVEEDPRISVGAKLRFLLLVCWILMETGFME